MKVINKLKKKLNNLGSSVIMVVVALGFIGIIIGALLSAASYAYRLKIQQMNAKDNFYYVEQAMQEIYVGVGTHTIEEMKGAYTYTIENMVRFNPDKGIYETISDEEANKMFKKKFMDNVKNSPYFNQGADKLAESLATFISNETVALDKDKVSIVKKTIPYTDEHGVDQTKDEIIIKDVTLTRVEDYDKNLGEGTFIQTLTADITIAEPDFDVRFTNIDTDYSVIFDYAVVADMGIEFNQGPSNALTVVGNLYGGSDYYNKEYNSGLVERDYNEGSLTSTTGLSYSDNKMKGTYTYSDGITTEKKDVEYYFGGITNKDIEYDSAAKGFVNDYQLVTLEEKDVTKARFDGLNQRSRYSGIYVDNSTVSVMAQNVVVPGTIAVMNGGNFSVYGKASAGSLPQVWTDDIILGGTSVKNNEKSKESKSNPEGREIYDGSYVMFRANLFVRDDMELNANGSSVTLNGSYYGYGNSTQRDNRVFFETVDPKYFMLPDYNKDGSIKTDAAGKIVYVQNRGHYNSSAIVINGEDTNLDFSGAKELYVAGRSYIEFSKYNTTVTDDNKETGIKTKTDTYLYNPRSRGKTTTGEYIDTDFIRDYKTGESIAYKPSQLMYNVSTMGVVKEDLEVNANIADKEFEGILLPEKLNGVQTTDTDFDDFFPKSLFGGYVPTKTQNIRIADKNQTRAYTFIDFETAYEKIKAAAALTGSSDAVIDSAVIVEEYKTLDEYIAGYAILYAREAGKGEDSIFYPELTDISLYENFSMGTNDINVDPDGVTTTAIYSSGAISVRTNNKFTMTTADNPAVISSLLSSDASFRDNVTDATAANTPQGMITAAYNFTNDLAMESVYMKWNLEHFKDNDIEKQFVNDVVTAYGEAALTPINKYMKFDCFAPSHAPNGNANYRVDGASINGTNGNATYKIWASNQDLLIQDEGDITGVIVCKGDVTFGKGVTSFTGLVVSGGKVFFNGPMKTLVSSPQACREIMKQCKANIDDERCKYFLDLFKQYSTDGEDSGSGDPADPDEKLDIDTIGYSDVVSMQNWTKSVGGVSDEPTGP